MASSIRNSTSESAEPSLLTANDPSPVRVINPAGSSSFLLIGDHAGNLIPEQLGDLGIATSDLKRHIAWDIGVGALGERLARTIDAVFVRQTYSRLVVDCNRGEGAHDAIAPVSDGTMIPANANLSTADRAARFAEIHEPYQAAIAAELARRDAKGQKTTIVALHSFTPRMANGEPRPWQIGILHDGGDAAFAQACLAALRTDPTLTVGDNDPYRMDQIDYTIPRHAYPSRPYAEIEIRQDLLGTEEGVIEWRDRVAAMLTAAAARQTSATSRP